MKKTICVVTGSRAEYGLLYPLLGEIRKTPVFHLQIIATGMHLSSMYGLTYKEILRDGFKINERVKIPLDSDTPEGITKSLGMAVIGFASVFKRLKPDLVILLGDRFETYSAAIATFVAMIPIAHIHGGELTEGAIDDAFRHSITKMSSLHFTSIEDYRRRVIQLGEDPSRVFKVGALGIDNIKTLKPFSRSEFQEWAGIKLNKHNLIITFHPVTLEDNTSREQFGKLLLALDEMKETTLLFTKANADTFGRVINHMIDDYVATNRSKAKAFVSMGQLRYLSAMKYADAVVGNSSSGIIEAPTFKIGTINIGDRQAGRIRAKSIIDCPPDVKSIKKAFKKLYSPEFKRLLRCVVNPYGDGNTAKRIVKVLKNEDLKGIITKKFYDIPLKAKDK
ncbi:MAG: UDP-N-acetylglucosamine 2-epimerase [Candidatus Omnitrophica bacterium]|nr:UDP-N-acetylglucosamine 2-epimerase [Candidatus Omnitrophota bacterium]